MLDLSPSTACIRNHKNHFGGASDHLPNRLSIGLGKKCDMPGFPKWIAHTQTFKTKAEQLINEVRIPNDLNPAEKLDQIKTVLDLAATRALKSIADGSAITPDQKIYWSRIAL